MKRNIITVALFAVLVTIAVSCQKENLVEPQSTVEVIGTVRTVSYTIDGVTNQIILQNDAEWDAFVDSMLSLSAQGHDVRFVNESASVQELPTNDVQTITTPDQEKAKAWSKEKADQGYTVSTTYANGQYTVIAIK